MEVRFSMTPRLIVLGLGCSLLLLVLMFSLGFLFGQRLRAEPAPSASGSATPATTPAATPANTVRVQAPPAAPAVPAAPSLAPPPAPAVPTPSVPAGR